MYLLIDVYSSHCVLQTIMRQVKSILCDISGEKLLQEVIVIPYGRLCLVDRKSAAATQLDVCYVTALYLLR